MPIQRLLKDAIRYEHASALLSRIAGTGHSLPFGPIERRGLELLREKAQERLNAIDALLSDVPLRSDQIGFVETLRVDAERCSKQLKASAKRVAKRGGNDIAALESQARLNLVESLSWKNP